MDTHDLVAFKRHIRVYVFVFVALLVATAVTVAVSYVHFGGEDSHAGNITVGLIIAGLKAFLVAGFFMHLSSEKRSIYTLLAATGVFVVGLLVLTVFAYYDPPELTEMGTSVPTAISATGHHEP
jgi:caa(3)-type oxidase subunit IV